MFYHNNFNVKINFYGERCMRGASIAADLTAHVSVESREIALNPGNRYCCCVELLTSAAGC